ncbi:SDR family oxidoreductase [Hydrogenophaga sp.]|uniref:SDR family oxidoreductase n=1 Tax=Hydrogenophaga sp. TaxID=1904254 RepID=UPI003F70C022
MTRPPGSEPVAIVTGAGSGIGKATTLALLADGWRVVLAGRRAEPLAEVVAQAGASLAQALAVPTDVADEAAVQHLFAQAVERFGRVDLLFNNAGVFPPAALLEDLELTEWQKVLDINLTGMFLCLREAFRVMKAQTPQGGRIINNGSTAAHVPRPNSLAYTATKHAVTGLTRTAALDGRKYGIACGQIDIGNAATELAARFSTGVMQADGTIATEPLMDVSAAARTVLHMANLPLEANVLFSTVMATRMPFVGRG